MIKYTMRCLKSFFKPFVDEICTVVLDSYEKYPMSSYVYIV